MLGEERIGKILELIERNGSVTIAGLMKVLDTSESTIRRTLNAMSERGLLMKVHGGAIANEQFSYTKDVRVAERQSRDTNEKTLIGQFAAGLIEPGDFVYLDAGTSTEIMLDYIVTIDAVFVTNALNHAKRLAEKGCKVFMLGGAYKRVTESVVGEETVQALEKYHFTKGFWGSNGVSIKCGFTAPDPGEAAVKRASIARTEKPYILAAPSKFSKDSNVQFAKFEDATIITTKVEQDIYKNYDNIMEVQ